MGVINIKINNDVNSGKQQELQERIQQSFEIDTQLKL